LSADSSLAHRLDGTALAVLVGLAGVLAALALPFAPVIAEQTTVMWPAPGQPVVSSTALFVPYRPAGLTAAVPCTAIRAAAGRGGPVTLLATGPDGDGLVLRARVGGAQLLLGNHAVNLPVPAVSPRDCRIAVSSGPDGMTVTGGDGQTITLAGEPVPKVFAFRTDLDAGPATGMMVHARTANPFATSPSGLKILIIVAQLLAALVALVMLVRAGRRGRPHPQDDNPPRRAPRGRCTVWVDAGVIAVLGGWAIIGPLAVDDGWAAMIARNYAATGTAGNYYRWWNASETPFALSQQLLAPLTEVSVAPLWLRLPSTVLAVATWFVLSRGVLPAALPAIAGTVRIRLLAAVCLLAAWLPFNLGARPESYVALGATTVLALLWRARGPAALGWAALAAAVTIAISPTAIVVGAPILVFAPRVVAILRDTARSRTQLVAHVMLARSRTQLVAHVMLVCCIGAVGLTLIFADQTWDGLVTATEWHRAFGPSLPWYHEPDRYHYLLGNDQQGSAAKRIPVLLSAAMLPIVAVLVARRTQRGDVDRSAVRLAAVVLAALGLLCLVPSKWSYHLGAMAGLFASFLVVALVLVCSRAGESAVDRFAIVTALAGSVLVAAAAGLAFTGPNAWWLPALYDVPWASRPVRPLGLPLDSTLFWIAVLVPTVAAATLGMARGSGRVRRALTAGPALLTLTAAGAALTVVLGSFVAAPIRRPAGSLVLANLHRLKGGPYCGLADDIEVLPDGYVLAPAEQTGQLDGFTALSGYPPDAPPPDPPGKATSTQMWGSWAGGAQSTGTMTSPWFVLPPLGPASGLAVSIAGRTDGANTLVLQFGRSSDAGVATLVERTPVDRVAPDEDPAHPLWRSIGLDAAEIPPEADRVRIRAVDARTDPQGWLAFTGPRLRSVVGLTEFLASHGPVLVTWPQSFLFPCVRDIPAVADGLAQAPEAVIEAPRPRFAEDRDQALGGTFAALVPFGRLYEVPTRLVGHPDIDWGALLLSGDTAARDAYQRSTTRVVRPGHDE
jgi:arabinosyltransferase B